MAAEDLFSGSAGPAPHVDLSTLSDGQKIEGAYAVREREKKTKKNGEPWIRVILADASGSVEAVSWDYDEERWTLCAPGTAVWIEGGYEVSEKWGSKVKLKSLREAHPAEYDEAALIPSSPVDIEELERSIGTLIAETFRDPPMIGVIRHFFKDEGPYWERFRVAAAAKKNHHAYQYGLLEHSILVAEAVKAAAGIFGGIDEEVAVAGALLHDVGKLWAYSDDLLALDYTDAGKLEGEIPMGYYAVRSVIEENLDLDPDRARALLHIILSHHGRLEYGSPVTPRTREAVLVHFMDNLGGTLGSFDRVEKDLPEGESWSAYDRALGGPAYFGRRD